MADITQVGILGLGRSGWGIHAEAFDVHQATRPSRETGTFRVTAVADPVAERRAEAEARFGCRSYSDPEELIGTAPVDLIVVATPSHTHLPLTLRALRAGKHVVVEKPMAQDPAGVDQMVEAAAAAGRVVTCYQPRRLDPDLLAIREVVESGTLGELILVRRAIHGYARRADWQMLRKFDGGALSNTVPHLLDQVLRLVDPAVELELLADLRHTVGAGDAEDHAKLALRPRDGNGPLLEVEASSAVALPQPAWLVVGTYGAISGSATDLTMRTTDPARWEPLDIDEGPAPGRAYGTGETLSWTEEKLRLPVTERSIALRFYDHLAGTLRDGAELLVTPESVRRQIEILQRARQQTGYL